MGDLLAVGWITAGQAAKLTGYHAEHLSRLARQGRVNARKVGAGWVFEKSSLLTYQREAKPGRKPRQK